MIDGDTISVRLDGDRYTVRLTGVDTPETTHPTRGVEPHGAEWDIPAASVNPNASKTQPLAKAFAMRVNV